MAETEELKAGSIILKDLGLFNRAAVFLETQIDPEIRAAIKETVDSWLEAKGWTGESDVSEEFYDLWVAPPHWATSEDDRLAKFNFGDSGESNSYGIADLFGVGQTNWGFRFEVNHGLHGGKAAWNTYAKGIYALSQRLSEQGWVDESKGSFFWPVVLRADLLAAAWENGDWAEALAPLTQGMDALETSLPIFDAILDGAKLTET